MQTVLRRRVRIGIILVTLMMSTFFMTTLTSASFLGGKFPHTAGQWLYTGYTRPATYQAIIDAAASSWHVTPTKLIVFTEDFANSELDYYVQNRSETWWGLAVHHGPRPSGAECLGGGAGCSPYFWADLYMNTRTLGTETDFIKQKVAAHEMGHGFGLAHAPGGTTSIMNQGRLTYNTPQTYDINDINSLYP